MNDATTFQNRAIDLDDFVNAIGMVQDHEHFLYVLQMSSTTLSIYHGSPSYQTQSLPTNRSGIMPFGGPTEPC
jgi:hypothetical protein